VWSDNSAPLVRQHEWCSATGADATPEFCSHQPKFIAQDSDQGAADEGVFYLPGTSIHGEIHFLSPLVCLKEDVGL
jgi:hypothetical protein